MLCLSKTGADKARVGATHVALSDGSFLVLRGLLSIFPIGFGGFPNRFREFPLRNWEENATFASSILVRGLTKPTFNGKRLIKQKVMKTYTKLLSLLSLMLISLSLTSCLDDDEQDAYNLSGSWEGDFGMSYNGYLASQTQITFIPDYSFSTHGTGYERDYYGVYGGTLTFDISWNIVNGHILISYYDNQGQIPDLETDIYNYGLNNYRFWGYVGNNYFTMSKISDWYDGGYDNGFDNGYFVKSATRGEKSAFSSTISNYDRTKVKNLYVR
jgi:hypothetical protein